MKAPRDIRVSLTMDEYVALKGCVTGELESLTESDWDSGVFDDLSAAEKALTRAWRAWQKRQQVRTA